MTILFEKTINDKAYKGILDEVPKEITCPICNRNIKVKKYATEDNVNICFPCYAHTNGDN